MTQPGPTCFLLGPQRPNANLGEAVTLAALPDGPVAVISSGWQEAEGDIDDVRQLVGRPVEDLHLYHRAEQLFAAQPDFHAQYRSHQGELKEQQRLYKLRLRHLMQAARQILREEGKSAALASEQRHAIAQIRALDRHHLLGVKSIHDRFAERYDPRAFPLFQEHVADIEGILNRCQAVVITGGNVIVTLNRMRIFRVGELLGDKTLLAWSAGAMVLADRIVLFHDRMPEGRRDAEVLAPGLGLVPGYLFLPDAGHRLRSNDTVRLALFCRRFSSETCVMLDSGSLLQMRDGVVESATAVRRIKRNGSIGQVLTK